jgi:hypothetical protein
MLVIEIDGSAHDTQKSCDVSRDRWVLQQYGVRTLRLTNDLVIRHPKDARIAVSNALALNRLLPRRQNSDLHMAVRNLPEHSFEFPVPEANHRRDLVVLRYDLVAWVFLDVAPNESFDIQS